MAQDPLRARYEQEGHPYGISEAGFDRWVEEVEDRALSSGYDPRTQQPIRDRDLLPDRNREARPR